MIKLKSIVSLTFILVFSSICYAQDFNFSMQGYATLEGEGYNTTTGGEGGDTTFITTISELESFAKSREKETKPQVIVLSGLFEASPSIVVTFKHGANLSILGGNNGAELKGVGIRIWDYNNVIIRNLKIHEIFYPNDALSVEECQHVWIDHNELHSKIGAGIGVDTYDGLLDIKKGSRYVTVSWNYLHDHMKCMLIGHTDNSSQGEEDKNMRITIHHNVFENTNGRNPSLRWGAAHIYNNYYNNIDDYAIALRQGAHGFIENNQFNNVNTCISTNKFDGVGIACTTGNIYTGTSLESKNSITKTDCEFWNDLPYSYELDNSGGLDSLLIQNTGVGIINIFESTVESDTSEIKDGINDFSLQQLKCYPNPAYNQLNLSLNAQDRDLLAIQLIDISGRIALNKQIQMKHGENQMTINTDRMQQGVYILKLTDSNTNQLIKRIVILQ
ncbi:MAG: T9SS type A sorting domain-containing protein [Prolixibacteraceae bacterium]|jgi:pectate lyase|nr:T9SS type A sorting domain-containing protein [Prolixibacteraceae bacterium]